MGGNNQLPFPLGDVSNISPPIPTELPFGGYPVGNLISNPPENSPLTGNPLLAELRVKRAISDYFPSHPQLFSFDSLIRINCTIHSLAILKPVTDLLQHQLIACDLGRDTVMQLLRGTVNQIESLLESIMKVNEVFCGNGFGSSGLSEENIAPFSPLDRDFGSSIGSGVGAGFIPTESILDLPSTGLDGQQQGTALCLHQVRAQLRQLNSNLKLAIKLIKELLGEELGACLGAIFKDVPRLTYSALSDNFGKCYQ